MATTVTLNDYPDLSERVYQIIRDRILSLQLPPGCSLVVVDLAADLGVSRTPVKEALSRLAAEGLVQDTPRRGYSVAELSTEDILDLLDARQMLELAAAERVIGTIEPDQLAELRRVTDEMVQIVAAPGGDIDLFEFAQLDWTFHLAIISATGNKHLVDVSRRLHAHLHLIRLARATKAGRGRYMATVEEHQAILAALELRDLAAFRAAVTAHTQRVMQDFVTAPETRPMPSGH